MAAEADALCAIVESGLLAIYGDTAVGRKRAAAAARGVRERLRIRGDQEGYIRSLVDCALTDWTTSTYDWLQKSMNGYTA